MLLPSQFLIIGCTSHGYPTCIRASCPKGAIACKPIVWGCICVYTYIIYNVIMYRYIVFNVLYAYIYIIHIHTHIRIYIYLYTFHTPHVGWMVARCATPFSGTALLHGCHGALPGNVPRDASQAHALHFGLRLTQPRKRPQGNTFWDVTNHRDFLHVSCMVFICSAVSKMWVDQETWRSEPSGSLDDPFSKIT